MIRRGVILAAFVVCCAGRAWSAPSIAATPRAPRPGEVVFVTLTPDGELARASCAWNGKTYNLLPRGARYQVILPVPASLKPGTYRAKVTWEEAEGKRAEQTVTVKVPRRTFAIQRLKLSAAQESKYEAPETKREYQLIGQALDLVTPEALWQGSFLMPVQGRITTSYGLRRYVNGRFSYRHRGMDLAAPEGTPVKAAADGLVALADESFLLHGQTVILDHGHGVQTLYLHLSEIAVTPGERVARGQEIGRVGATGVATGPHLHYAVYVHHEAVDPAFWTRLPER